MAHSLETGSPHDISQWHLRAILVGIPIGMIMGTWGNLLYDMDQHKPASFLTAAYHAVQLFVLHMPHLEGTINLPLEIGRWVAAASTGLAFILFLKRAFMIQWRLLSLPRANDHLVICGLGVVGTRLALDYHEAGENVVAVERNAAAPGVREAEARGIAVVLGDAKDLETLRRARAHRARKVLAVCSEDDTNIAIATAVRELDEIKKSAPPDAECLLLLADPKVREKVAFHFSSPGTQGGFRIKAGGFYVPDTVARQAFLEHPLDFDGITEKDSTRVHLVIVGTCDIAEGLAVKALQLCHFANRSRLRLTIVGNDAKDLLVRLQKRHPFYKPWYHHGTLKCNRNDTSLPERIAALPAPDEFVTVAICPPSGDTQDAESKNFLLALAITDMLHQTASEGKSPRRSQILVHFRRKAGFGKLLELMGKSPSVHAFGLVEALIDRDALLHETQDTVARALHDDYRKNHSKENVEEWSLLSEELRDSNRLAADHIPIKLRAIGLSVAEEGQGISSDLTQFNMPKGKSVKPDPRLILLSKMEHARWCAERYLLGWRYGKPKNRTKKINDDLVPWGRLKNTERKKDLEQISVMHSALSKAKKIIVQA